MRTTWWSDTIFWRRVRLSIALMLFVLFDWLPVYGQSVGRDWQGAAIEPLDEAEATTGHSVSRQSDQTLATALEAKVAEAPGDHALWRELGWVYWRLGERQESRRVWRNWRRLDPEQAEPHALLGRLELAENRFEAAIAAFRRSLALDPEQPEIRYALAQALRWSGFLDESIERLKRLHAAEPDDHEIVLELARALSSNWQYADAMPYWKRLRDWNPDDVEVRLGEALAVLHTGAPRAAALEARRVLIREPDNLQALRLLADEAEFSGRYQEAADWLTRWIDVEDDTRERRFLQNRLLSLLRRLRETRPEAVCPSRQVALAREVLASAPRNPDAYLSLSDLLLEQGRHDEAESLLVTVLRTFNARHYRARLSLFEITLASGRADDARRHLEAASRFHPEDPYLNWYDARWHAVVGNAAAADAALDRLAAAGERGSTAVLLYHALSPGDFGPALSVNRFREHLRALLQAGYAVVTPEHLHADWDRHGETAGRDAAGRIRRVVAITFDDALESAMRFGTPVAVDYGLRFGMYIPVGFIERGEPYICSWDTLAEYALSGAWEFGSHLYFAHDQIPIDRSGTRAYSVAARQWLPTANRLETEAEYKARLRVEYAHSRDAIREHLGQSAKVVAYPYGDIGQEGVSNVPDAIAANLAHASRHHDIGFIQTPFAHAVRGANPLLYGRHEMDIHWSGDRVVRYLFDRHPVILAERTRLSFAHWSGDGARARRALHRLAEAGYDPEALRTMASDLSRSLSPLHARPAGLIASRPASQGLVFRAGLDIEAFRDNLKARALETAFRLETDPAENLQVALRLGVGRRTQSSVEGMDDTGLRVWSTGLTLAYLDPNDWTWEAGAGLRGWSGDADGSRFEGHLEGHGRLTPLLGLRVGMIGETPEQAAALAGGLHRVRGYADVTWDPAVDWRLGMNAGWAWWSDENAHLHLHGSVTYAPLSWRGLFVGARHVYRQSDVDAPLYWTPKRLSGGYALMGYRGRTGRHAIEVSGHAGYAREVPFLPDAQPAAEAEPASADWEPAYGAGFGWRHTTTSRLQGGGRLDWTQNPDYGMIRAMLQGTFSF